MYKMTMFLLIIIASFLSLGCYGVFEVDDASYILSIGIDKAPDEDGKYIFTYRIALPKPLSGGGGDKESSKVVSVKAASMEEALLLLTSTIVRRTEASHANIFIIHEEVAKEGIKSFIEPIIRSNIYRSSMNVYIAKDNVKEMMEKNKTPFENIPSRFSDSLQLAKDYNNYYFVSSIREAYTHLRSPIKAAGVPALALKEKALDEKSLPPVNKDAAGQYGVDNFPVAGGVHASPVGTAIIYDFKFVDYLTTSESRAANLIHAGLQGASYTVTDPTDESFKIMLWVRVKEPKVNIDILNEQAQIDISVKGDVDIIAVPSLASYQNEEEKQKLETVINNVIKAEIEAYFNKTKLYGADIIFLGGKYRKKISSFSEWKEFNWPELYKNAQTNIDVDIKIKRTGLSWRRHEKHQESKE